MDIFSLIKRGGTITSDDLVPKPEDFIPNYKEIMEMNKNGGRPNPHDFEKSFKEAPSGYSDGFVVKKQKEHKKPYKQSCSSVAKEEEKKSILKAKKNLQKKLKEKQKDLERWDKKAKDDVKKWFGSSDEKTRKTLLTRTKKMQKLLDTYTIDNFKPATEDPAGVYAYVYADDDSTIYLGEGFCDAPETGRNSKTGTLAHEMSHFDSVGGTNGKEPYGTEIYGEQAVTDMANYAPSDFSLNNAETFEYYIEG